jgi:hypothetical protein
MDACTVGACMCSPVGTLRPPRRVAERRGLAVSSGRCAQTEAWLCRCVPYPAPAPPVLLTQLHRRQVPDRRWPKTTTPRGSQSTSHEHLRRPPQPAHDCALLPRRIFENLGSALPMAASAALGACSAPSRSLRAAAALCWLLPLVADGALLCLVRARSAGDKRP